MSSRVNYYVGGDLPAAPQRNRAELWDGAAGTYTAWAQDGTQTTTRALTATEAADLAANDVEIANVANTAATGTALTAAMTRLTAIINQGNTLAGQSTAWTVAQQKAVAAALSDLALIDRRLIREALNLRDAPD